MNEKQKERRERRYQTRGILWRWAATTETCASKQDEIKEYLRQIESAADIKPQCLTGMPHSGTTSDPTPRAAEKIARLREKLQERINKLVDDTATDLEMQSTIDDAVRSLGGIEQLVINAKYKQRKKYEQIAEELGYCVDRVKQIDGDAVDKIAEKIS